MKLIAAFLAACIAAVLSIALLAGAVNLPADPCGDVPTVLATIRTLESGGDYTAKAQLASASGAYQIIDSTWASWSRDAGVGTEYRHASDAPPAVQDAVAAHRVTQILDSYHDVSVIPLIWYYPAVLNNPALLDILPAPEAGNRLTPRQYQTRWMTLYTSLLPRQQQGAVCERGGVA